MTQLVNPWLQFIGPKGQITQNQWLQKLNDLYNNPQLRFAVDRAGNLIDKTQTDEEESDVEKLSQTGSNILDTVRQLQQMQQPTQQVANTGASSALINSSSQAFNSIFGTAPKSFIRSTPVSPLTKTLATSPGASQSAFNMVGNIGKKTLSSGITNTASNVSKPMSFSITKGVETAGKAGVKGAQAASNTASIAGGAAGLALTAGSHLFDIGMSTRSKFRDKVAAYEPVNSYDDLNNFNIHYADRKLSRPSFGSMAADVALKTTEGALAGAMLANPWTVAGGAVGGFFAGIGNSIAKVGTYKTDQRRALNSDNLAYNSGLQYFHNAGNQLNDMTNTNTLYNLKQSRGQKMAEGGQIENVFNNGGTHESNPYGGIFQGQDQVEEGEVRIGDFIFSARVTADRDILSKFNCAVKRENATYADIAKQILDNFNERNDYISNKTKRILFERLAQAQEYQKVSDEAAKYGMTPEEYTQYQQQLQEQQAAQEQYQQEETPVDEQQMMMQQPFYEDVEPQQYAFGGKMFANGGNRTEPKKPPYTGNLYEKPKSNWQKLQEQLEEQFPELQKHRRDIYDFVKSHLSGVGGDMELAYELTYGGLNDLLFGTSGTNEEFQNAIFAAMPFVGKIKGVGSKAVNAGKKLFNRTPKNLNVKTQWWRTPFGTSQKAAENKFIRKVDRDDSLWSNITKKDIDKLTNKEKQEIIERFEKGDIFKKPYEQLSSAEKHLYDNLETLVSGLKNNPDYFKTTHAKDIWNRTRQIIVSRAVLGGLSAGLIGAPFAVNKVREIQERNDAAENAIRNSINETYGYNNVYNSPINNLPQYVAAPDESTAYNPNVTLNTNTPTTTKPSTSMNNGKSKYKYVDYTDSYKQNRDNDDILNKFLKYYNDNNKTKYDLNTIRKNLSDNKLGPITKSFMDWLDNRYKYDPEWIPEYLNATGDSDLQNTTPIENLTRPAINDVLNDSNKEESEEPNDSWKTGLYDVARAIPTLGKLRGIFEQEEPSGEYANEILSYYRPTDYNQTGRYKTYSPADQYMLMRQTRAQRNALAQQYLANAGGNPAMANYMLVVNDAQYNQDLADNYLKVKQYNDQLRDQALEYNNQLDEANEVRRANIQQANNQLWANLGLPAAAAREQERRDVEEAKYANQESFWNDLATIARERQDRELIRRNPALFYDAWMNYKG